MCLAVPGQILDVDGDDPLTLTGRVSFNGVVRRVSLALVPDAPVGAFVIVHAGFALAVLDEAEAGRVIAELAGPVEGTRP